MGYPKHRPLNDNKHALAKPMSHTKGHKSKDIIGLGYGVDDNLPIYDEEPTTASDSDDVIQPMATTILEDVSIPSTSILWGEDELPNEQNVEAFTSRQIEFDESRIQDPNRECIKENISHLLAHNQSTDSNEYEWDSLSNASHEVGVDVVHTYTNQTNVFDESFIGFDESNSQLSLVDHVDSLRSNSNLGIFKDFPIGPNSLVTIDDSFHINNMEPSTFLSLVHSNLIDWSIQNQRPELPSF